MGAVQQFVGYLGMRRLGRSLQIKYHQPHWGQHIKYWIVIYLCAAAAVDMLRYLLAGPTRNPAMFGVICLLLLMLGWTLSALSLVQTKKRAVMVVGLMVAMGIFWQWRFPQIQWLSVSLQIGLLDPICFLHRAFNLVLLPLADQPLHAMAALPRYYEGGALVGSLLILVVLLCLRQPRFYCRYVCPLGGLLGLLSRWALWRMGKAENRCQQCHRCETHCEGACAPSQTIQIAECVLCLNCKDICHQGLMGYHLYPSAAGEIPGPDLTRRHVVSAVAAGLLTAPLLRVDGRLAGCWNPQVIRPPGALDETSFLARCIKCGQCMRVCPTNVIHPANWQAGAEGLWTPVLNFRVGTSGCQHNCVACSHVCPTTALRPLSVDERMGRSAFADTGPVRLGTAFIDRGRCLPWAMDTPCIVCQENCPVSPKAIFTRLEFRPLRKANIMIRSIDANHIALEHADWPPNALGGGDFFVSIPGHPPMAIQSNTADTITVQNLSNQTLQWPSGQQAQIVVRLQQPYVDPHQCIGCGICEHECPVQGKRAIRITAENESRHLDHRMLTG